jgi:uncharacterized protein YlxW (UPF0749 family)
VSVLAQAQQATATTAIREWATVITSLGQAFPRILAKVNEQEVADTYGELLGIPSKLIRSDEEVAEMERAQQEQQQAQQALNMIEQGSSAAKDLSASQTGNDTNLLQRLFGDAGAQGGGVV